jgi:hypothetical protein
VSAVQSHAAKPQRGDRDVPRYVYVAAILLIGWAALVLTVLASMKQFGPFFWRAMIPVGLELATAAGLLLHRRWGWCLGITTSVFLVEEGLRRVILVGSDLQLVVLFAWMIHYFIPAIVLLVCLLPSRARIAFLGERQSDVG